MTETPGQDPREWYAAVMATDPEDWPPVRITTFDSPPLPADRLGLTVESIGAYTRAHGARLLHEMRLQMGQEKPR